MTQDVRDLIAEARKCAPGDDPTGLAVMVHRLVDALEASLGERDAAVAAIERVRAQHQVDEYTAGHTIVRCVCEEMWPCSTIQALDGAPEPEGGMITSPTWQDGCPMTVNELPNGGPENYKGHIDCQKGV